MNEKVEALEAQCAITLQEKKRLADEADTTAKRLVRAEKLTSGLASEGVRWLESLDSLGKQKVKTLRAVRRTNFSGLDAFRFFFKQPARHSVGI